MFYVTNTTSQYHWFCAYLVAINQSNSRKHSIWKNLLLLPGMYGMSGQCEQNVVIHFLKIYGPDETLFGVIPVTWFIGPNY